MTGVLRAALAAAAVALFAGAAHAEVGEIKITKQPGVLYAQLTLMEDKGLLEKHAEKLGIQGLKVQWMTFTSGGVATEALLSGQVDIVTSGVSNMLLLWAKTNGQVKGVAAVAGLPFKLLTRNPNVKTIKDFGPNDRIAVPTIKVSMQAITLGIALRKAYGDDAKAEILVANQVQLGHPEATQALLNPNHEVNTHFSISPFQEIALKNPAVHEVANSVDMLGGLAHVTMAFATTKFTDANPKVMQAFLAAFDEASEIIAKEPKAAAESYLKITKDKLSVDELTAIITQKGAIFQAAPVRTMIYAEHMHKIGIIKQMPKSWKDYMSPALHSREGS